MKTFENLSIVGLTTLSAIVISAELATPALAKGLLIKIVTVISGERVVPLIGANVLIENGQIATLSASADSNAEEIIDGTGKFLIPGLIDSHVHLYHATGLRRRYTDEFDRIYDGFLDQLPRSFLYFGYTSVVELNSSPRASEQFVEAPLHPSLRHCGHGLVLSDGFMALEFGPEDFRARFPHFLIDHHRGGKIPEGVNLDDHTPKVVVARLKGAGAICIKLYFEEALWMPGGPPPFALPSVEILREVVTAAHKNELPVLLHATTPDGHRIALEAGVDILAHGLWEWPGTSYAVETVPSEIQTVADAVAAAEIGLQPTMRTIRNTESMFDPDILGDPRLGSVLTREHIKYLEGPAQVQRDGFLDFFGSLIVEDGRPDAVAERLGTFNRRYERLIGNMAEDGATLLFGTDTTVGGFGWGNAPGLNGYLEMKGWYDGGVPLRTIFEAATLRNAEAFGLADEVGRVAPGLRADLLLLATNPLKELEAYDQIEMIILGGLAIDREELSAADQQ